MANCRRTEFLALLEGAKDWKRENQLKEFHRIIQNIMRIRKSNTSVTEIEDPNNTAQIIHEPDKLRQILLEKYQNLFKSSTVRPSFEIREISHIGREEINACVEIISSGKGLGTDCIPDTLLQLPNSEVRSKLYQFVNAVFQMKKIPEPFCTARLHLVNKLKSGVPGIEDLRPIMVSSPLIKVIESIALIDLKARLEPAITAAQRGFISKQGTHIHIYRLLT